VSIGVACCCSREVFADGEQIAAAPIEADPVGESRQEAQETHKSKENLRLTADQ